MRFGSNKRFHLQAQFAWQWKKYEEVHHMKRLYFRNWIYIYIYIGIIVHMISQSEALASVTVKPYETYMIRPIIYPDEPYPSGFKAPRASPRLP